MNRQAIIHSENVMGEILTENAHSALIKYNLGGFQWTEWFDREDYEALEFFEYEGDE